jgi:putative SOS response-associated peptidase YedK
MMQSCPQRSPRYLETGEPLKTCTMIINNANELVSKVHDRMPVLLAPMNVSPGYRGAQEPKF